MSDRVAYLVLADGLVLRGKALGAEGVAVGEVVFTTGMTGYQEVLTDPSYHGQIVTMTAAQIGNTGIVPEDAESVDDLPRVAGFLVNDASDEPSNWRSTESLHAYLARHGVVGLSGVDTRTLTRHLRDHGAQNGAIGTGDPEKLLAAARAARSMAGLDLVREVTPKEPYTFSEGRGVWSDRPATAPTRHVVAIDCGLKRNILRCLVDAGCRLTVVPATTSAEAILARKPDGVFLSNGPGDPAAVTYVIETIRGLLGKTPLFGICLGHQMLALALGATTYKLKFGHRGCNQPVIDLTTGRVEITTQNHGFAVDLHSLAGKAETTHLHLNDRTSEGLSVPSLRAFSVQYHPEAAAGPHDSMYLFDRFVSLMDPA
jgi:carbamoyl-phosphate synthase small subunit